jgi:hypothetical protein
MRFQAPEPIAEVQPAACFEFPSPSPWPSPSGRGKTGCWLWAVPKRWPLAQRLKRTSLSPRERARVRGKEVWKSPSATRSAIVSPNPELTPFRADSRTVATVGADVRRLTFQARTMSAPPYVGSYNFLNRPRPRLLCPRIGLEFGLWSIPGAWSSGLGTLGAAA